MIADDEHPIRAADSIVGFGIVAQRRRELGWYVHPLRPPGAGCRGAAAVTSWTTRTIAAAAGAHRAASSDRGARRELGRASRPTRSDRAAGDTTGSMPCSRSARQKAARWIAFDRLRHAGRGVPAWRPRTCPCSGSPSTGAGIEIDRRRRASWGPAARRSRSPQAPIDEVGNYAGRASERRPASSVSPVVLCKRN